jgi:hypothetical protein
MSKYLQFSAILWKINNVETGEFHSVHTNLEEACEIAKELGKDFEVFYCAIYNPIRKERLSK